MLLVFIVLHNLNVCRQAAPKIHQKPVSQMSILAAPVSINSRNSSLLNPTFPFSAIPPFCYNFRLYARDETYQSELSEMRFLLCCKLI